MLSPETKDQLAEALSAVLEQLGDDPDTAELRGHLEAATDALQGGEGEAPPEGEPEAEEAPEEETPAEDEAADEEDAYSFDKAREKFAARRAKKDTDE